MKTRLSFLQESSQQPIKWQLLTSQMNSTVCSDPCPAMRVSAHDPDAYRAVTKPFRLNGHCTSVRLEKLFWSILSVMACSERVSLARIIHALHEECLEQREISANFASYLRVMCLGYVANGFMEKSDTRYANTTNSHHAATRLAS